MDRRLTHPVFGNAPDTYDMGYLDDLSRKLNILVTLLKTPGEGRNSTLVLTNLTSNDYGLEPGTLFQVNGQVFVSVLNRAYVEGQSATGSVGSVRITP
jgi:hypothetical protein